MFKFEDSKKFFANSSKLEDFMWSTGLAQCHHKARSHLLFIVFKTQVYVFQYYSHTLCSFVWSVIKAKMLIQTHLPLEKINKMQGALVWEFEIFQKIRNLQTDGSNIVLKHFVKPWCYPADLTSDNASYKEYYCVKKFWTFKFCRNSCLIKVLARKKATRPNVLKF